MREKEGDRGEREGEGERGGREGERGGEEKEGGGGEREKEVGERGRERGWQWDGQMTLDHCEVNLVFFIQPSIFSSLLPPEPVQARPRPPTDTLSSSSGGNLRCSQAIWKSPQHVLALPGTSPGSSHCGGTWEEPKPHPEPRHSRRLWP